MIVDFLEYIHDLPIEYLVFGVTFLITFFVVLYAIALIHEKLRMMESMLDELRKEQSVITDELEIVATANKTKKTEKGF